MSQKSCPSGLWFRGYIFFSFWFVTSLSLTVLCKDRKWLCWSFSWNTIFIGCRVDSLLETFQSNPKHGPCDTLCGFWVWKQLEIACPSSVIWSQCLVKLHEHGDPMRLPSCPVWQHLSAKMIVPLLPIFLTNRVEAFVDGLTCCCATTMLWLCPVLVGSLVGTILPFVAPFFGQDPSFFGSI